MVSNPLAKTDSKLMHPLGLNFVAGHTHTHTHTHTNGSENITPPQFCGGVKRMKKLCFRLPKPCVTDPNFCADYTNCFSLCVCVSDYRSMLLILTLLEFIHISNSNLVES